MQRIDNQNMESLAIGQRLCRTIIFELRTLRHEFQALKNATERFIQVNRDRGLEMYLNERMRSLKAKLQDIDAAIKTTENEWEVYRKNCNFEEIVNKLDVRLHRVQKNLSSPDNSIASTEFESSSGSSDETEVSTRESIHNHIKEKEVGEYSSDDFQRKSSGERSGAETKK